MAPLQAALALSFLPMGPGRYLRYRDPVVTGTIQLERSEQPQTSAFAPRSFNNTNEYNFAYNQGFVTGTALNLTWNNSRTTTTSPFNSLQSPTAVQLQGHGDPAPVEWSRHLGEQALHI